MNLEETVTLHFIMICGQIDLSKSSHVRVRPSFLGRLSRARMRSGSFVSWYPVKQDRAQPRPAAWTSNCNLTLLNPRRAW